MKVILTADVDSLGREGDIKEVKNGLARNFLLPKKLAVRATPGNLKIWEQKSGIIKKKRDEQLSQAEGIAQKLEGVALLIPVKVGEEEKLFGSVTSQNIADELAKQGLDIDKRHIALDSPIKSLGNYDIKVKLYHEVAPSIKVHVVDEENPVPIEDKEEDKIEEVKVQEEAVEEESHEQEVAEETEEAAVETEDEAVEENTETTEEKE